MEDITTDNMPLLGRAGRRWSTRALPFVVRWLERSGATVREEERKQRVKGREREDIDGSPPFFFFFFLFFIFGLRKLSCNCRFALAMWEVTPRWYSLSEEGASMILLVSCWVWGWGEEGEGSKGKKSYIFVCVIPLRGWQGCAKNSPIPKFAW